MPRSTPYLQRRGDTLYFRIAVPADLRPHIRWREITKSLQTIDRRIAVPMALSLASQAKTIFNRLRGDMGSDKGLRVDLSYELTMPTGEKIKIDDILPSDKEFAESLIRTTIQSSAEARQKHPNSTNPAPIQEIPTIAQESPSAPMLSAVINHFLEDQGERGIDAMMTKHNQIIPIFLEIVRDKPVSQIRQADILDFFGIINRLPTHAQYDRDKGMTYREIIELPGRKRLAKATFDRTYRASVATLLDWAKTNYQDQGFPSTLTVERIEYRGDRKEGEQKQRALTKTELKRLFEGEEVRRFASDSCQAHQFWLPHIALFTGARVNEICQLNPQTDIQQDPMTGIWYFRITEDTEAHADVKKSVKTGVNRDVPLHAKLLELGLLSYIERVRAEGAKLLFPTWKPRGGRAAKDAGEDFISFLKEIGLHGAMNENGRAIRGSHAFRHTILTYGKMQGLNLRCITGHKERSDNEVADGYEDDTIIRPLTEKKRLLDQLDYGLIFVKPDA